MSTYLDMWVKIKELDLGGVDGWIMFLEQFKNLELANAIDFYELKVSGIDLLEALRNYKEDLINV